MISLSKVIPVKCILGEGLFVKNQYIAWVDIKAKKIYLSHNNIIKTYDVTFIPTAIIDIDDSKISIVSNIGVVNFYYRKQKIKITTDFSNICKSTFRSNDAGFYGKHLLFGFMHKQQPLQYKGIIYSLRNEELCIIDEDINIPNSFIEIEAGKVIISDSGGGLIWLYSFDKDGSFLKKDLWHKMPNGICPDGGCLINDLIFLSVWDDSSITVFNKQGTLIKKIKIPILRPTNCKFDKIKKQLWVTSASEGIETMSFNHGINNGDTLIYDLDFI